MARFASCALLIVLAWPCAARAQEALVTLDRPHDYRSQRASTSAAAWATDNTDFIELEPGKTATLATLAGPGRITHMWFTYATPERSSSRRLTLRIYWDGESSPSVEAPLGDFFGVGHGMDADLNSIPVRVTANGRARNCYWPMPFGKSARIELTNDGLSPVRRLYFQADWQQVPSLAAGTPCFHARYRQQDHLGKGRYVVLDAEGKGHYVGTVMSVRANAGGWFGEGDDFFFIDGEKEPSLRGTGTEDYVGDAWEFRQFDGPYYGVPVYEGNGPGTLTSYYRWHIADPIAFEKSLRFEIEHTGPPSITATGAYTERADDFASVAFWYQVEPHKAFGSVPPVEERLGYSLADTQEVTLDTARSIRAEHSASSGGASSSRPLARDRRWKWTSRSRSLADGTCRSTSRRDRTRAPTRSSWMARQPGRHGPSIPRTPSYPRRDPSGHSASPRADTGCGSSAPAGRRSRMGTS